MLGLGTQELIIILIILLLLFGSRLPSIMRSLGKSVNEFKKGMNESADDLLDEEQKKNNSGSKDQKPPQAG